MARSAGWKWRDEHLDMVPFDPIYIQHRQVEDFLETKLEDFTVLNRLTTTQRPPEDLSRTQTT